MTDMRYAEDRPKGPTHQRYEVSAWAVLVGVALAMRLAQLDAAPLSAAEIREAAVAWRAATGQGMPVSDYSPLLFAANSFLFVLFGASDSLARLLPALAGSGLVLTPILLRRRLGRVGSFVAGLYLAISPTALVASRQLDGTALAAAGTMGFVGALSRFLETDRKRWLAFAAVGLAVSVTSGAAVYGLLLPLGLAWGVLAWLGPHGWASPARGIVSRLRPHAGRFLLLFGLAAAAASTGLGWNPSGAGAIGGLLVDWFARFRAAGARGASPFTLLVVYELLGLVFALAGLVWGLRRQHYPASLLGLWSGLGAILLAAMPGRAPTDLVWVVLPLAMLAGIALEAVARDRWRSAGRVRCIYAGIVLILWAQVYLALARYARFADRTDLVLVLVVAALQLLLGLTFVMALGPGATLRTAAVATGAALFSLTVSAGWGVAYRRPADPREPLSSQPTPVNVRDLVETLRGVSWQETGMLTTLEFVYEAPPNSVLAWYLRDFGRALRVDSLSELGADRLGPTVVTLDGGSSPPGAPGTEYVGQSFALRRHWAPESIGCRFWDAGCSVAFDWFLFRDGPALPDAASEATLWRRVELPGDES
ncbi:MAG: hypothetical protein R6X31_09035 [Anaerolineae bacterium]